MFNTFLNVGGQIFLHTLSTLRNVKRVYSIVTCYLRSQPIRGSFLGNSFVNTQQYWSRC
jgi:hypothetical protein